MGFLTGSLLWGAGAAAIPLLLHLLFRSRYRPQPWGAMALLRKCLEQTRRRVRLQEWVLLLLRMAALVLLAVALARPILSSPTATTGREAVEAWVLVDVSGSMSARDGAATRLDVAKAAVGHILDHLPPDSHVKLYAMLPQPKWLGPEVASDVARARTLVSQLRALPVPGLLLPAIQEVAQAWETPATRPRELYVVSDMQATAYEGSPPVWAATFEKLRSNGRCYWVRCGDRPLANATLVDAVPAMPLTWLNQPAALVATVRNTGQQPLPQVTVTLTSDAVPTLKEVRVLANLRVEETRSVTLSWTPPRPGPVPLRITLSADDVPLDNVIDRIDHVQDRVNVLIVDGHLDPREPERSGGFFLGHALRQLTSADATPPVRQRSVVPAQADPGLLADVHVCCLVDVAMPTSERDAAVSARFLDRLVAFVQAGGSVVIFGGVNVNAADYHQHLHDQRGLLPTMVRSPGTGPRPLRHFDAASAVRDGFLAPFREEPLNRLGQVDITAALDLAEVSPTTGSRVLLRFADRQPAVVSRTVGRGEVILIATTADRRWTDWPLWPTYVPFMQALLGHVVQRDQLPLSGTAGETVAWRPPPALADAPMVLETPTGERIPLGTQDPTAAGPKSTPVLYDAGLYRLVPANLADWPEALSAGAAEKPGLPLAMRGDPREFAVLGGLSDAQIDQRLGASVEHVAAGTIADPVAGAYRLRHESTLAFLMAVLILLAAETLVAGGIARTAPRRSVAE